MATRSVKDLRAGDLVKLTDPAGIARVRRIEPSRLFKSPGGCFRLDLTVTSGPHKGQQINDQHHGGFQIIEMEG